MELKANMIFTITEKFIPNFSKAQTLRILHLNEKTVKIEMNPSKSRGAFPIDQFKGIVRDGTLILSREDIILDEVVSRATTTEENVS